MPQMTLKHQLYCHFLHYSETCLWIVLWKALVNYILRSNHTSKMGTFLGHITPGGFFIVFGFAWMIGAFRRYHSTKHNIKCNFKSSLTWFSDNHHVNIEGLIILFFSIVGIFIELPYHLIIKDGLIIHNYQHAIMYVTFGFAGLAIALHKALIPYLPDIDKFIYGTLSMAFLITGLLFQFHLWGRDALDKILHTLLIYCLYSAAFIILIEMNYRESPFLSLMRNYIITLSGTWITQIGFILYNPFNKISSWNPTSEHDLMEIGLIFSVHILLVFMTMLIIGISIAVFYKRKRVNNYFKNDNVYKDLLLENDE